LGGGKDIMNEEEKNGSVRRHRRLFDETYKRHAVELTLRGDRGIAAVAKEIGISEWTLRCWRKRYAPGPKGTGGALADLTPEQKDEEIGRLRAEIIRMREREIVLKKSLGILSETPESGMPRSKR
jgi:transposase-like protein